jgi:F-type H+-transporting ATPase subunit gamma
MAKARALDRRRTSIKSIRKITRTMELISRAQFKRAMDRASAATAYTQRITALVDHLARTGLEVSHPLLEKRPVTRHATLLVLTANRGLCGGYNSAVLRTAVPRYHELTQDVPEVRLEVSGKRGIANLKFRRFAMAETFTHFNEKVTYEQVDILASRYLDAFALGELDRLDVAYMKFETLSRQHPVVETLLPLGDLSAKRSNGNGGNSNSGNGNGEHGNGEHGHPAVQYDFFPSAASILDEVVPASFKSRLFKCFLDAAVSEQIARMVAMKAATENAETMIGNLSMAYNRARQGQITGELLEIIGGAEALN